MQQQDQCWFDNCRLIVITTETRLFDCLSFNSKQQEPDWFDNYRRIVQQQEQVCDHWLKHINYILQNLVTNVAWCNRNNYVIKLCYQFLRHTTSVTIVYWRTIGNVMIQQITDDNRWNNFIKLNKCVKYKITVS
jgi:hypothetical protein